MQISEVLNKNKPYIVALNTRKAEVYKEYPITIEAYRFDSDALNNKCLFFTSKTYAKDFYNADNDYDDYLLCCKDKSNLYIWNKIKIEQLQNNKGFYAITESTEASCKSINKNKSNYINHDDTVLALNIKLITSILLFTLLCLVIIVHSDFSFKNILHSNANSDNQTAIAGAMAEANYYNTDKVDEVELNEKENIPATTSDKTKSNNDTATSDENLSKTIDNKIKEELITDDSYTYVSDTYNGKNVTYIKLDNDFYTPKLVASDNYSAVATLVKENGGTIGINASAWNKDGSLDMTYLNNSWLSDNNDAYVGDPLVFASGTLSAFGYDFTNKELIEQANPDWVCTGFNAVIYSTYSVNTDWNEEYNRSFIGQLSNGDYIIGVIEDATYSDMVNWARNIYGYDINILYNLDGGGSCGLFVDGTSVYSGRNIKTAIIF